MSERAKGEAEMEAIPVIGLWQPYASLVAIGAKPWETRHFPPPPRLIGKRVAIQATLRKPTRDEITYGFPPVIAAALGGAGWERRVPYGAIVCTAVLVKGHIVRDYDDDGMVSLADWRGQSFADDGFGDYTIGRWCWAMTDVRQVSEPIPLKGRQEVGWLWSPTPADRAALRTTPPASPRATEPGRG